MHRIVAVAFVAWTAIGPAIAQQPLALRGEALIGGRSLVDPPPDEPRDSHAYLTVKGPAALAMYRRMTAREEANACLGRPWRLKRAGALVCTARTDGREASCDFAIDLRAGALDGGRPC